MNSTQLIRILRLLPSSSLSLRSNLIICLIFNDQILIETKSDVRSSKSISTYKTERKDDVKFTAFEISGPDIKISEEFLKFPKLFIIEQRAVCESEGHGCGCEDDNESGKENEDDIVKYYKFGPSSRLLRSQLISLEDMSNKSEIIEIWTDHEGLPHRDNDYAMIIYKKCERDERDDWIVTVKNCYFHGILDSENIPTCINRDGFYEIKELYNKDKENFDINKIKSRKMYYQNGKSYREDGKPFGVIISESYLLYYLEQCQCHFRISNNPNRNRSELSIEDIFEMIEDFGNYDIDGNDSSDRYLFTIDF